jgi:epoxyqueuosine reductase
MAAKSGGWIYGCDICQDVCPWNHKFASVTAEEGFGPRPWNVAPDLEEWRNMTQDEFNTKFKGSAMKRTKRDGLTRNVEAVLQHSDDDSGIA